MNEILWRPGLTLRKLKPASRLRYRLLLTDWLGAHGAADTVFAATLAPASPLTASLIEATGDHIDFIIDAGAAGQTHNVAIAVDTNGGQHEIFDIKFALPV